MLNIFDFGDVLISGKERMGVTNCEEKKADLGRGMPDLNVGR